MNDLSRNRSTVFALLASNEISKFSYGRVAMVQFSVCEYQSALSGFQNGRAIIERLWEQATEYAMLPRDLA